jgi:3-methyladenine DNA glycosylase AlkD
MYSIEAQYAEVIDHLKAAALTDKTTKIKDLKKYIGTAYDFIGLSVPAQRQVSKDGFSFTGSEVNDQFAIWNNIYQHAAIYEGLSQPFYFLNKNKALIAPSEQWRTTKTWTQKLDNWAHSDSLSEVYAHLLEIFPDQVYEQLQNWTKSSNPWERRQSVVALLYYSKLRKNYLPVKMLLNRVSPLLAVKDYYVQKGIGWTLREIGNLYPEESLRFILTHCKTLSPVAFTSAIEKMHVENKLLVKKERKDCV